METTIVGPGHVSVTVEDDFNGGVELAVVGFWRALHIAVQDGKLSNGDVDDIASEAAKFIEAAIQNSVEVTDAD